MLVLNSQNIITYLEESYVDLNKTVTSSINNGGAITFQFQDTIEFIFNKKLSSEIEFLAHLVATKALTQDSIECFLKHMMFDKETASLFTQWQRQRNLLKEN
jgi:hypothetical protein